MTAATLMANAPARVNVTPFISSRTSSGRKMAVATAAKYSPQRLSSHNPTPSMASRAAYAPSSAALEAIEGVGLWLLKRWGEYFAAVATAIFLPLEVRELIRGVTFTRAGAFAINVAAVIYLLLAKRLFGLRGGRAAYDQERHGDSLLEVEAAA